MCVNLTLADGLLVVVIKLTRSNFMDLLFESLYNLISTIDEILYWIKFKNISVKAKEPLKIYYRICGI